MYCLPNDRSLDRETCWFFSRTSCFFPELALKIRSLGTPKSPGWWSFPYSLMTIGRFSRHFQTRPCWIQDTHHFIAIWYVYTIILLTTNHLQTINNTLTVFTTINNKHIYIYHEIDVSTKHSQNPQKILPQPPQKIHSQKETKLHRQEAPWPVCGVVNVDTLFGEEKKKKLNINSNQASCNPSAMTQPPST